MKTEFKKLLDTMAIGYLLVDGNQDNTILDVNNAFIKMTGMSRKSIVGLTSLEFYGDSEYRKLKEIVSPYKKVRINYQFEFFVPTKDGDKIPVLHNVYLKKDKKGNIKHIYTMITDIRKQKKIQKDLEYAIRTANNALEKLDKEKSKLETILFGIEDCVTIFEPDGHYILSNPRGLEIRGSNRTPFLDLIHGNEKQFQLDVNGEKYQLIGKIQEICDQRSEVYAYVETLKDITPQIKLKRSEYELTRIKRKIGRRNLQKNMVGVSKALQKVFEQIILCADVDSTILILGETGVGKELVAKAIHTQSNRKDGPFVAINCNALSETLLESEIFGHVKGSFTGAISERAGLFQEAHGGTLFLDEIGDIGMALQGKLLRVLQDKEVRPLGSNRSYPIDVRVITATNSDLELLVKEKHFRLDLYYRIAVIPIFIPPLRERKDDIISLAKHFIKKSQKEPAKSPKILDQSVQQILLDWTWPGNIRELENVIEHCVAMSHKPLITPDCLPVQIISNGQRHEDNIPEIKNTSGFDHLRPDSERPHKTLKTLREDLFENEKTAILESLNQTKGHRTLAAKELGISRTTLYMKMRKYNLM